MVLINQYTEFEETCNLTKTSLLIWAEDISSTFNIERLICYWFHGQAGVFFPSLFSFPDKVHPMLVSKLTERPFERCSFLPDRVCSPSQVSVHHRLLPNHCLPVHNHCLIIIQWIYINSERFLPAARLHGVHVLRF